MWEHASCAKSAETIGVGWHAARGLEIAEFAMILPMLFLLLIGIFWFGQAFELTARSQMRPGTAREQPWHPLAPPAGALILQ